MGSYAIRSMVANLEALGCNRLILKSDQEPAMKALRIQVKTKWARAIIPRHSPVRQSQPNGLVEKAIREVENQLRAMLLALERRLGTKFDLEAQICLLDQVCS